MNSKTSHFFLLFFAAISAPIYLVFLGSCSRSAIKSPDEAMRPASFNNDHLSDDLDFNQLLDAIQKDIEFHRANPQRVKEFRFGKKVISRENYLRSLDNLLQKTRSAPEPQMYFFEAIKNDFEFYEVYGTSEGWGDVFMTSYFEPIIEASKTPTKTKTQALYRLPNDLIEVPLEKFGVNGSPNKILIGRLSSKVSSRGFAQVLPYYTRHEIDRERSLASKKLEIAFADPIEVFFLQIQGSGTLKFDDGSTVRVHYAGQNGQPYIALGKFLKEKIPTDKMSSFAIENYLRSLEPDQIQDYLEFNPSYVFFREATTDPVTFLGTEVVPGRTIATDLQYFPKGTLAFLEFEKPVFETPSSVEPKEWQKTSRFVIDQDRGGAISGPGRLDLFWGRGPEAKQAAGVIKNHGKLYYLVPRDEAVARLPASLPRERFSPKRH